MDLERFGEEDTSQDDERDRFDKDFKISKKLLAKER